MDSSKTLVLGGTGKTGRRVVQPLVARGLPVRVGSRQGIPSWPAALERVRSVPSPRLRHGRAGAGKPEA